MTELPGAVVVDRDWRRTYAEADSIGPRDGRGAALIFISTFGSLQSTIDLNLELYLRAKMPTLGPKIHDYWMQRLGDQRRISMLLAIAEENSYSVDTSRVRQVYMRANDVRNKFAHGRIFDLSLPVGGTELAMTAVNRGKSQTHVTNVTPAEFADLVRDCAWLEEHVDRIAYETGVLPMVMITGGEQEPYVPPVPPAAPPHR